MCFVLLFKIILMLSNDQHLSLSPKLTKLALARFKHTLVLS